ncbi:MAG: Nramp family divalent metal transporter [Bdellovibrio sp.]|nr:Nramp family divalent metal transporter [Bdellovibrio sp.]
MFKFKLPDLATAPFCPSEIQGSVVIPTNASFWKKLTLFLGPGLLVSVGYMDPGNWATDIEAGSKYGYSLLFIVLLSSLAGIFLQCLTLRVGLVSGRDIAQLCRDKYSKKTSIVLWLLAEIAIIATDIAEVLGCALAFKLLLGCTLPQGIAITALDTLLILGLKGKGFRQIEAIILGLVMTIGICYFIELWIVQPVWGEVLRGYIPSITKISETEPLYLAIGILGATVMPHNLYLHSSIVQTRLIEKTDEAKKSAIRMNTIDTVSSLFLAFLVNSAILILAAAAFNKTGNHSVAGIDEAFHLLDPVVGSSIAAILFGVALLAAGQSSTFTGTIAGQIILDGFLNLKIPCWKRRIITRGLALIPAYMGVKLLGEGSTGRLLVLTQVILSLQLPFVIFPLIRFVTDKQLMGKFTIRGVAKLISWLLFLVIVSANICLLYQILTD